MKCQTHRTDKATYPTHQLKRVALCCYLKFSIQEPLQQTFVILSTVSYSVEVSNYKDTRSPSKQDTSYCYDARSFLWFSSVAKKNIGLGKSQYWLKQMNFLGWSTNHKLNTDTYPKGGVTQSGNSIIITTHSRDDTSEKL